MKINSIRTVATAPMSMSRHSEAHTILRLREIFGLTGVTTDATEELRVGFLDKAVDIVRSSLTVRLDYVSIELDS